MKMRFRVFDSLQLQAGSSSQIASTFLSQDPMSGTRETGVALAASRYCLDNHEYVEILINIVYTNLGGIWSLTLFCNSIFLRTLLSLDIPVTPILQNSRSDHKFSDRGTLSMLRQPYLSKSISPQTEHNGSTCTQFTNLN